MDEFLYAYRHHAFLAVAAVIGHNEGLVAVGAYLVFQNDEVLAAAGQHTEHTVAHGLQGFDDGEHGGHAHTAAGTNHGAEFLNVGGVAERTYHIGHIVAYIQVAQLGGAESHLLNHKGNRAALGVGVGYRQGNPFSLRTYSYYHKMAGLAAPGYERCLYLEEVHLL